MTALEGKQYSAGIWRIANTRENLRRSAIRSTVKSCLAASLAACALANAAASPAAKNDAEGPASRVPQLQEIIVTAEKRHQNIQDVPAAVTAITAGTLANIGADKLSDYVAMVPGLVLSNVSFANGSEQLSIRGITTGFGGNPTVGIYIDDSPFGGSNGFAASIIPDLDTFDLKRIEVLEGPQGTLYGAGSLGGLVKFVTVKPDPSRLYGQVEIDGSQVDGGGSGFGLHGGVNIPLGRTLALRVSGFDREDPGFVSDAVSGRKNVNVAHVRGGHIALRWDINDFWTVDLSALMQQNRAEGTATADYNSFTFQPVYGRLRQARAPGTGARNQDIYDYDLEVHGDLGWATLTSATSYNDEKIDYNLDVSPLYSPLIGSVLGVANAGASVLTDSSLYKYTEELRLASPGTNRLSWLVGLFYTHEYTTDHQYIPTFDATTGGPLPVALPLLLDAHLPTYFEEKAVFGDLTYRITSKLRVTVGGRYSENNQSQTEILSGLIVSPSVTPGSSRGHSATYLVTPSYHFSRNVMAYARVASGYRPGGPNLAVGGTVPPTYGPDRVVSYELGMKSELLGHRLMLNADAYYIDWTNIQVNELSPSNLNYFGNAGRANSKGVETSFEWRPLMGLEVSGNLTYTLARLATGLPPGGGAVGYEGDRLPDSPEWAGSLSVQYSRPLRSGWIGTVGVDNRYLGARFGEFPSVASVPRYPLPAYDEVNLRAGVSRDGWAMRFYAKNVGNADGKVDNYLFGSFSRLSIIQPRTFELAIEKKF